MSKTGGVCLRSASWIRKQASVSPEGTLVLSTQAPIEDAAVWRLIQASGEAGTNLTELLRALRATRVDRISSESKAIRAQRVRQRAYHGAKGGDSNHSGFSPYVGVADVSKPLWSFHHPEVGQKKRSEAEALLYPYCKYPQIS